MILPEALRQGRTSLRCHALRGGLRRLDGENAKKRKHQRHNGSSQPPPPQYFSLTIESRNPRAHDGRLAFVAYMIPNLHRDPSHSQRCKCSFQVHTPFSPFSFLIYKCLSAGICENFFTMRRKRYLRIEGIIPCGCLRQGRRRCRLACSSGGSHKIPAEGTRAEREASRGPFHG